MPSTTTKGFPYPLATEPLTDGAVAIQHLAEAIDARYAVAITLPAAPVDGQESILVDNLALPTFAWRMRWHAAAARWLFVGGADFHHAIDTDEVASAGGGLKDLPTVGPLFTAPRAGAYLATISAIGYINATTAIRIGLSIGGAVPLPTHTVSFYEAAQNQGTTMTSGVLLATGVAAAAVLKVQYDNAGGAGHFMTRKLAVRPVYLT